MLWICPLCARGFATCSVLCMHLHREHGDPFYCDACGREFNCERSLIQHCIMMVRRYQCPRHAAKMIALQGRHKSWLFRRKLMKIIRWHCVIALPPSSFFTDETTLS